MLSPLNRAPRLTSLIMVESPGRWYHDPAVLLEFQCLEVQWEVSGLWCGDISVCGVGERAKGNNENTYEYLNIFPFYKRKYEVWNTFNNVRHITNSHMIIFFFTAGSGPNFTSAYLVLSLKFHNFTKEISWKNLRLISATFNVPVRRSLFNKLF